MTSDRLVSSCQKHDAGETSGGVVQPSPHLGSATGKCSVKDRSVLIDPAAGGPVIGEHKQPRDARDTPTVLPGELRRDARLAVEGAQHRLKIGDDRFDFDNQQRTGRLVECKDVYRAAIPAYVERQLSGG